MVKKKQAPKSTDELLRDLDIRSTYARKNAIIQLASRREKSASGSLCRLCADSEATIRACAAWALGEIGDSGAARDLMPLLKDMDTQVRRAAVKALGQLAAPETRKALEQARVDSDRWVCEMADEALAGLEKQGEAASGQSPELLELKA